MRLLIAFTALLTVFASVRSQADDKVTPTGVSLFDGTTLSGWHGRPHLDPDKYADADQATRNQWAAETSKHWTIQDGEIVNDGNGPFLVTDDEYGDIELRLKYKTVPAADSGIYLRGTPQVQIWDFTDESKFSIGANLGSGGLWNNSEGAAGKSPSELADYSLGEWNEFRVIQVGARTTVYLNGKLVVDHAAMENFWNRAKPLAASGPIELQTHGGEIRWKDISVRRIPADEANAILAQKSSEGFETIFDGKTLNGWSGAVDDYEVADGAIRCRDSRGGHLYTDATYDDFAVRLEFQVPPGGNNGLAIRYPGKGDPAYDAFCELQVLDNTSDQYAKLDPRQYHGSAYGIAAAEQGYLREVGAWNFQEVTVVGSHVKVELNGTVILKTDLAEANEFLANREHSGLRLRSGHFGFAGHTDPVKFRNVQIKKLMP